MWMLNRNRGGTWICVPGKEEADSEELPWRVLGEHYSMFYKYLGFKGIVKKTTKY